MGSRGVISQQLLPQKVPPTAADYEDESSVWSSMLKTVVSSNATRKMPSGKSIIILGDNESGKTTLVAKLQGVDAPKKGCGLEYGYLEIRDEYRDDSTQLSVWVLDGNHSHSNLLQFALNENTFNDVLVMLTVSMEKPWNILDQLQSWFTLLHDHVDSLNLSSDTIKELRDKCVHKWLDYIEPGDEIDIAVTGKLTSAATATATTTGQQQAATSPTTANNNNNNNVLKNSTSAHSVNNSKEHELISLPGNVLSRNLGLDIIVVVTKTDYIGVLERENDYKDEHFDFIQHHIRQVCLQYGASLFYTSVKEDKNCDLLYKYLVHRVYSLPFRTPALIVEKDAVFIPAGWDNEKKMAILHENMNSFKPDEYFNVVIEKPVQTRKSINRGEIEFEVEDEQKFLERQIQALSQGTKDQKVSPHVQKQQSSPRPSTNPITPNITPKKGETTGSQERVLANFFNSLLSKRSPNTSIKSNEDSSRSEAAAELDSILTNKSSLNNSLNHSDC